MTDAADRLAEVVFAARARMREQARARSTAAAGGETQATTKEPLDIGSRANARLGRSDARPSGSRRVRWRRREVKPACQVVAFARLEPATGC